MNRFFSLRPLRLQMPVFRPQFFIAGFFPLVFFALLADSRLLLNRGIDGQFIGNIVVPIYLLFMLGVLSSRQRLMALIFVPISALGEFTLTLLFGLYDYKFGAVPVYVPFGHAVLLSAGALIAESAFTQIYKNAIRSVLLGAYAILFGGVIFIFGDSLSAVLGAIFGIILWIKRADPFYLMMGFLVIYVEILGTAFGCWAWIPAPFGFLHTTNPPVGALTFYVIGDMLALAAAQGLAALANSWSARREATTDPTP